MAMTQPLARGRQHPHAAPDAAAAPDVATLLAIDAEYRTRAGLELLPKIAPRRLNPRHRAWLPVWHAERDGWHLTALFSNTLLAHQRGATRSWVILYYQRKGQRGQCTVVTEFHGTLSGRRVIRGREAECSRYYSRAPTTPDSWFCADQIETG